MKSSMRNIFFQTHNTDKIQWEIQKNDFFIPQQSRIPPAVPPSVVLRVKRRERPARIHAPIAIQVLHIPRFFKVINDEGNVCVPGKYASMPAATSCDSCMSGKYTSNEGMRNCAKCEMGKISPEGAKTCTSCVAGFYSEAEGSTSCSACSSGTFASNVSSTLCER